MSLEVEAPPAELDACLLLAAEEVEGCLPCRKRSAEERPRGRRCGGRCCCRRYSAARADARVLLLLSWDRRKGEGSKSCGADKPRGVSASIERLKGLALGKLPRALLLALLSSGLRSADRCRSAALPRPPLLLRGLSPTLARGLRGEYCAAAALLSTCMCLSAERVDSTVSVEACRPSTPTPIPCVALYPRGLLRSSPIATASAWARAPLPRAAGKSVPLPSLPPLPPRPPRNVGSLELGVGGAGSGGSSAAGLSVLITGLGRATAAP